jgi:hypothetical protein
MPLFDTARGTRLQFEVPPSSWPELQKVCQAYMDLQKERKVTGTLLGRLEDKRLRAIEDDRVALGKAIKEGTPDPGDKNVEKIEKEIRACRRRLEALEPALDEAEIDLLDVLDAHRDEWVAQLEAKHAEAQTKYAEAVEALNAARSEVSQAFALLRWVKHFPEEEQSFRVRGAHVGTLKNQRGDMYPFAEVVAALREDATPQVAAEVEPIVPPSTLRMSGSNIRA